MRKEGLAGYLILVGVAQFLLFMIVAEAIYPGYSISHNYISDLGVGSTAIIFNASIILMGALVLISSIILGRSYFIIAIIGLFSALVGVFPETTGFPHSISALITFLFGGIAAIYYAVREKFYVWIILGVISLIALVLYVMKIYGGIGYGGMERMIVYPELIWGLSFASYLIKKG